jgi:hypothetical protein
MQMIKSISAILAFFFLLYSAKLFAQTDTCNCSSNLQKLIAKTEENYAGFPVKVNTQTRTSYRQLMNSLLAKAANESNPKACFVLLKEYVRFFKDKHFNLVYPIERGYEMVQETEAGFKQSLSKKSLAAVEGVWVNADSSIKLGIRKHEGSTFKAVVLASSDSKYPVGLVYFTLQTAKNGFVVKEHDRLIATDIPAKQRGQLLQIWSDALFGKVYPVQMGAAEQEELNTWKGRRNGLNAKKLSDKTAYLKVPTFLSNDDLIQQLVSEYDSLFRSCDNLIVDLTGNGGGNTGWVAFLQYFMTNPIEQYNTYLRVTPENVQSKLADLAPFATAPIPDEYKKYFPEPILAAYMKAYQELPTTKAAFYPIPGVTFPLDSVIKKPKRIGLIVDDFCGSSAEYFFSISKQSKKTITYGIPTIGMMDYEGMSNPTPLPFSKFIVTIPIVQSSWTSTQPIDQSGFKPDILLNKIDQTKWVEFVRRDLERR